MRAALALAALLALACGSPEGPKPGGARALARTTTHIYVSIPKPVKRLYGGFRHMSCDVWLLWCGERIPDPRFR